MPLSATTAASGSPVSSQPSSASPQADFVFINSPETEIDRRGHSRSEAGFEEERKEGRSSGPKYFVYSVIEWEGESQFNGRVSVDLVTRSLCAWVSRSMWI